MKIISTSIYEYRLRMVRPVTQHNSDPMIRTGCLICLTDEDGNEGWGEAAPLPGLSRETLDEVKKELLIASESLDGLDIPTVATVYSQFSQLSLSSSARFAIESASLNLVALRSKTTLSKLLNPQASNKIKLNGLVAGDQEQMIAMARQLLSDGFETLKIKVGRLPVDQEIATITKIVSDSPNKINYRFDANRSWSVKQYEQFISQLPKCKIEYIEEPLSNFVNYKEVMIMTALNKIPIALDESLLNINPIELKKLDWVNSIVLKPSLFGFDKCDQFLSTAKEKGIGVTISSLFESSIGISALAHYSSAHCKADIAAGLDTVTWLRDDVLKSRVQIDNGQIDLNTNFPPAHPDIDFTVLKKLNSHA